MQRAHTFEILTFAAALLTTRIEAACIYDVFSLQGERAQTPDVRKFLDPGDVLVQFSGTVDERPVTLYVHHAAAAKAAAEDDPRKIRERFKEAFDKAIPYRFKAHQAIQQQAAPGMTILQKSLACSIGACVGAAWLIVDASQGFDHLVVDAAVASVTVALELLSRKLMDRHRRGLAHEAEHLLKNVFTQVEMFHHWPGERRGRLDYAFAEDADTATLVRQGEDAGLFMHILVPQDPENYIELFRHNGFTPVRRIGRLSYAGPR